MNLFKKNKVNTKAVPMTKGQSLLASDYCEAGKKAMEAGKNVEAMEYFQAAIEIDPKNEEAYLLLIDVYRALGVPFPKKGKFTKRGSLQLKEVAWSWSEGMETHEVGKKRPNELGLYDMLGNVSELCDGCFLRGGGDKPVIDWYLHDLDRRRSLSYIKLWRITAWTKAFLPKGNPYIGFRLAMNDWSYEGHSVIS